MRTLAEILHDALAGSNTGCLHPKYQLAQCDALAVVLDAAGVIVKEAEMCGRADDPTQHDIATCDVCGRTDDHEHPEEQNSPDVEESTG